MKKIFFIALYISVSNITFAQNGWVTQYVNFLEILDFCMVDANVGYACGSNGMIIKTTNGGDNWSYQSSPISNGYSEIFFADANTGWAVGSGTMYVIIHTTNGGTNWSIKSSGSFANSVHCLGYAINTNTFFMGFRSAGAGAYGRLAKSDNSGTTLYLSANINNSDIKSVSFIDDNTGWFASYYFTGAIVKRGYIAKTTNCGAEWITQRTDSSYLKCIKFVNAMTGFAVSSNDTGGTLLKTTNGGVNWNLSHSKGRFFSAVEFVNESTGWAGGYSALDSTYLCKTTNSGGNWTGIKLGIQIDNIKKIKFLNSLTGWALGSDAGYDGAIFKTTNGGNTFVNTSSTLIPERFLLMQNYPNPFNPVTKIKFALPQKSFIKINLIDLTGKIIAELVNENLNAGSYETEFNGTNLSSGIYYYRIEAGDFVETKKMILIK